MDAPQIIDLVHNGIVRGIVSKGDWHCGSIEIVPKKSVSTEESTILSEDRKHPPSSSELEQSNPELQPQYQLTAVNVKAEQ